MLTTVFGIWALRYALWQAGNYPYGYGPEEPDKAIPETFLSERVDAYYFSGVATATASH